MQIQIQWRTIIYTSVYTFFITCFTKLWEPVAAQIGFPVDFEWRVEDLLEATEKVRQVQADLLYHNPKPVSERCRGWLDRARELCTNTRAIKAEYDLCMGKRLNYFIKCRIGKQADRQTKKADQLRTEGEDLLRETKARPPPVSTAMFQHAQIPLYGMETYKGMVLGFLKYKESNQVPRLGIWGMGGVGKTALLETLRDSQVAYDHFDHVLFVRAGMGCTVQDMRDSISAILGLSPTNESMQPILIQNCLRFKSFLLLIDDLWDSKVDLGAVGIPMPLGPVDVKPQEGISLLCQRKLVFTTRSHKVCEKMKCCGNNIHMDCLKPDDSWALFTDHVGDKITEHSPFHQNAKKVKFTSLNHKLKSRNSEASVRMSLDFTGCFR